MKRKYLLVLPALVLFSGLASAATLIVNCGTVSGPTELAAAAILCPQFNLAGQALSNISIGVSGGITGFITLTNGDDSPQSGSGTTTTSFNFGGLSGFTFVNPVFSATFGTGVQAIGANTTVTFGILGSTPISTGTLGNDNTSFAPYTGGGNFNIPVTTVTSFLGGGSGGAFSAAQSSNANATAVVTYTYDAIQAVPEPATISLLGLGLLGVGFITRKLRMAK